METGMGQCGTSQPAEATQKNDIWDVELPFGMPKETKLLPAHSQELLRAARSGRLYKRPAPTDDDDENNDIDNIKGDKKESDAAAEGFTVKMWKQTPRNIEGPAESHLAKRHKNTVTLPPKSTLVHIAQGPTVTRAKVRRIDAAGNPYEQTITLAEGQQVDGEIISKTVVPAPVVAAQEAAAQAAPPAPVRRRPPPPKRKAKGPGRGRKKGKLPIPTTTRPGPTTAEAGNAQVKVEGTPLNGIKQEEAGDSANQDSEMADSSHIPSDDDDGDDGDEGEEEGDADESMVEGETPGVDNSLSQDQDQEMTDAGASEIIRPSSIEEPEEKDASNEEDTAARSRLGSSLAPPTLGSLASTRLEGSPLKHVMIRSPTEPPESRSDVPGVDGSFFPSTDVDIVKTEVTSVAKEVDAEGNSLSAALLSETVVEAEQSAADVGDTANDNTAMDIDTGVEQLQQPAESAPPAEAKVEDLEAALSLPGLRPDAPTSVFASTTSTTAAATASETTIATTETASALVESSLPADTAMDEVDVLQEQLANDAAPAIVEPLLQPPDSPALLPTATTEDEDDGLNLLGSLERELDRQEEVSRAGSAASATNAGAGAATETESNGGVDKEKDTSTSEEKPLSKLEAEAASEEAGGITVKPDEVGTETTVDATTDATTAPTTATTVGEEEKPTEAAAVTLAENKEEGYQQEQGQKKEEGSASTAPSAGGDSVPKESEPADPVQQVAEPSNQE
ncbi:unnamed protein product [Sordaria macrospora k-hell]|uniref:WGS project CABT00000000 data, contig 2.6 n=1 Tax=Sordaria macrospora (strain ATCC MYA-333 / DSM 997 / K(L3346) / K-hell) TaxID=771870 RepID=F7VSZ2_SORMK|nr:uncharacterized protein SMAC_05449 [Sordaria macrospora k-hell]CCC08809.1 unnamed protein product [Sordaria macrospora k-hell]